MREIEFRAKVAGADRWIYGLPHKVYVQNKIDSIQESNCVIEYIAVDTLGQFTGFKDRNGIKIYEGDIVKMGKGKSASCFVIKYFDNFGMFGLSFDISSEKPVGHSGSSTSYKPYVLSQYYQSRVEVIGNIHENPELLTSNTGGL